MKRLLGGLLLTALSIPALAAWGLPQLMDDTLGDGEFWNVNFPHLPPNVEALPETRSTQPARSPLNVEFAKAEPQDTPHLTEYLYTASYAGRPQDPGSDVQACFGGASNIPHRDVCPTP